MSRTHAALQWFYSRGATVIFTGPDAPSASMLTRLQRLGLIHMPDAEGWRLTDEGRAKLWEDTR